MSSPDSDAPDAPDCGGHPLFPRPETAIGPDRRNFDWILVRRWGPDGKMEVCPKRFKGSELRSWEQIIYMYGGECTYQLTAQSEKTDRFTAFSEKVHFAGPPRRALVGGDIKASIKALTKRTASRRRATR